jgi:hypothetical protein
MRWGFNSDSFLGLFVLGISAPIIGVIIYIIVTDEIAAVHDWHWWLNDPLAHRLIAFVIITPMALIWGWIRRRRGLAPPEPHEKPARYSQRDYP